MSITPTPSARKVVVASRRRLSTHSGRIGSAARRSANTNATSRAAPPANTRDADGRAPRPGLPALEDAEDEQRHAAGQQHGAEVVDVVLAALHGLAEVPQDEHAGEQAQRAR